MKRRKRSRAAGLQPPPVPKIRNPVARSPLMKKGGAHGKTTRAARRLARIALTKVDPRGET